MELGLEIDLLNADVLGPIRLLESELDDIALDHRVLAIKESGGPWEELISKVLAEEITVELTV